MKLKLLLLYVASNFIIVSCNSQTSLDDARRQTVLEVLNSIVSKDSIKFYSLIQATTDKTILERDFKFLTKRFQKLKYPLVKDSLKHYEDSNSIWKWNYKTRVYLLQSKYDYVDLTFMFNQGITDRVFLFSQDAHLSNAMPILGVPKTN